MAEKNYPETQDFKMWVESADETAIGFGNACFVLSYTLANIMKEYIGGQFYAFYDTTHYSHAVVVELKDDESYDCESIIDIQGRDVNDPSDNSKKAPSILLIKGHPHFILPTGHFLEFGEMASGDKDKLTTQAQNLDKGIQQFMENALPIEYHLIGEGGTTQLKQTLTFLECSIDQCRKMTEKIYNLKMELKQTKDGSDKYTKLEEDIRELEERLNEEYGSNPLKDLQESLDYMKTIEVEKETEKKCLRPQCGKQHDPVGLFRCLIVNDLKFPKSWKSRKHTEAQVKKAVREAKLHAWKAKRNRLKRPGLGYWARLKEERLAAKPPTYPMFKVRSKTTSKHSQDPSCKDRFARGKAIRDLPCRLTNTTIPAGN